MTFWLLALRGLHFDRVVPVSLRCVLGTLSVILAAGCVTSRPIASQERPPSALEAPTGVRVVRDIAYRTQGADTIRMDLLLPTGDAPTPAIVFVGETAGPRRSEQLWAQATHLARLGFAGAIIDYQPRSVGTRMPIAAAVSDAKLAVRWLRAHADQYGIDRSRIGMVGASRGALVAALAGLPHWLGIGSNDNVGFPAEVAAVVLIDPLLDLADAAVAPATRRFLDDVLGGSAASVAGGLESQQPVRERISPLNYFGGGATRDVREHVPPFLLLHGRADEHVPFRQSERFAQELRAHGIIAEMFAPQGAAHGFVHAAEWRAPALGALSDFFRRVLTGNVSHAGWLDSRPVWSPDGTRIAFHSDFGGEWAVWLMRTDGSELRRVAPGRDPAWAPDGSRLVFESGAGRLATINTDGSGMVLLTSDTTEFVHSPWWSPDGLHIAYSSWVDNQLYVIRLADGAVRRLTDSSGGNGCASWFPDGSRLLFHSGRDGQSELYMLSIGGGGATRLTDSAAHEFCPRSSPDGRHIAFQRRAGDVHQRIDIFVTDADGSQERNLTDHAANDRWASWSPDGSWIAFASTRGGNADIYVVRADGTGLRRLTYR